MKEFNKQEIITLIANTAERMGLDIEDLIEMIPDLINDSLNKLNQMLNQMNELPEEEIKLIAHDLKGAFRNFGLDQAGEMMLYIEQNPTGTDSKNLSELIEEVINFITQIKLILEN